MAIARGGRRLTPFIRGLILKWFNSGLSTVKIRNNLQNNYQFLTTRQSIRRFIIRYQLTGSAHDKRFVHHIHVYTSMYISLFIIVDYKIMP